MSTPELELESLEQQRLAAIGSGDPAPMAPLLADDYLHVNSTGRVIDKAAFLKNMTGRARLTTRGPLSIKVYGDTATIFGEQINRTEKPDGSVTITAYVATQVAQTINGRWQLVLMQLTEKEPK